MRAAGKKPSVKVDPDLGVSTHFITNREQRPLIRDVTLHRHRDGTDDLDGLVDRHGPPLGNSRLQLENPRELADGGERCPDVSFSFRNRTQALGLGLDRPQVGQQRGRTVHLGVVVGLREAPIDVRLPVPVQRAHGYTVAFRYVPERGSGEQFAVNRVACFAVTSRAVPWHVDIAIIRDSNRNPSTRSP